MDKLKAKTDVEPNDLEKTFKHPEELPSNDEMAKQWQLENKTFWESNSMRYDWKESIPYPEFSREYYNEIDARFMSAIRTVMPWRKMPFEQWLDPATLAKMDVLEIGIGNGTHAQLIAPVAKSYTGIDLTEYASGSTRRRLEMFGLAGSVHQMDAENLDFPAESFDFVWSWGVIHHSSNTRKILEGINRVLRPGGKAVIMVYYRSWWSFYTAGFLLGLFKGHFFKGKTLHQVNQSRTDGALARYYTFSSWRKLVGDLFTMKRLETLGNKGDLLPMPGSNFKNQLLKLIPTGLTIFFLRNLRMGSFLICEMVKK